MRAKLFLDNLYNPRLDFYDENMFANVSLAAGWSATYLMLNSGPSTKSMEVYVSDIALVKLRDEKKNLRSALTLDSGGPSLTLIGKNTNQSFGYVQAVSDRASYRRRETTA